MLAKLQEGNLRDTLNSLDMASSASVIPEREFRNYYLDIAGREHYRLLAYLSSLHSGAELLDIGTYKGCSALALSLNASNRVHTFDIADHRRLEQFKPNVRFYQDDILKPEYRKLILSSRLILLDTVHDGRHELRFLEYLREIGFTGYLLLDDIHLNEEMKRFWAAITGEKHDLSPIGHYSGTGLVVFEKSVHRYAKESYITAQPTPFGFWEHHPNRHILELYRPFIRGRVFDLGCNHGASTYWLKGNPSVTDIVGYDLNEEALKVARSIFSRHPIPSSFVGKNLADGAPLGNKADTLISFHALEHIHPRDVQNFLSCAYQALNEGGYFVISIPYDHAFPDPCHVSFFIESSLIQAMRSAGFETVECFKDDRFSEKDLLTGLFRKPG